MDIDTLKRKAKVIKKAQQCTHTEALDLLAREKGYQNWSMLSKNDSTSVPNLSNNIFSELPAQPPIITLTEDPISFSFDYNAFEESLANRFEPSEAESICKKVKQYIDDEFSEVNSNTSPYTIYVDPDSEYMPYAITRDQREQAQQYIKSLPDGYRDKFEFGFIHCGNLSLEIDWTDTPQEAGEEYHTSLMLEEYERELTKGRDGRVKDFEKFLNSAVQ